MATARAQQWAEVHLEHVQGEELRRSFICGWNGDESDMGTRTNKKTKAEYGSHSWKSLCAACLNLWGVKHSGWAVGSLCACPVLYDTG